MLILCQIYLVTSCADSFTELWNSSNVRYSIRNGSVSTPTHFYYSFSQFYYRIFSFFYWCWTWHLFVAAGAKWEVYCGGKENQSRIKKEVSEDKYHYTCLRRKVEIRASFVTNQHQMYNKYHPLIFFFLMCFDNLLILIWELCIQTPQ